MAGSGKKFGFGLSVPKARLGLKSGAGPLKPKLGIFGCDDVDDDDDDVGGDAGGNRAVEAQIAAQQRHAHSLAKNEDVYKEALAQDPTVFDYDEVYDNFHAGKSEQRRQDKLSRQSKYIAELKTKAAEREREQEMVHERKMVREVEKEEHLYGNKEKFITSAYRKKLEEDRVWQEQEDRREEEERRNDVTKRSNLGAFYSNLLTNNVAFGNPEPKKVCGFTVRLPPVIHSDKAVFSLLSSTTKAKTSHAAQERDVRAGGRGGGEADLLGTGTTAAPAKEKDGVGSAPVREVGGDRREAGPTSGSSAGRAVDADLDKPGPAVPATGGEGHSVPSAKQVQDGGAEDDPAKRKEAAAQARSEKAKAALERYRKRKAAQS